MYLLLYGTASRMKSAIHVLLVCGIIASLHDTSVRAKRRNVRLKPGRETCAPVTDRSSKIRLKCGSKDVIYTLAINTFNKTGCDGSGCSGLQPQVLTDSLLCYSRRNCSISFSNRAPIVKTDNALCIGKAPSSLKLSYLCVKKKIFIAINRKGKDEGVDEVTLDQGVLVSHATYPWHYSPGLMLNMTLRPKSLHRRTLYLSVPMLDIDSIDEVKLKYMKDGNATTRDLASIATGISTAVQTSSESGLVLMFNTDNASTTGRGFLLCFYWAEADENMSNVDICSKVTSRKQKGRKRKKGEKRKRKKESKSGKKKRRRQRRRRKSKKRGKRG